MPSSLNSCYQSFLKAPLEALKQLIENWDEARDQQIRSWCQMVLKRPGRVVLTGMGKSGLVAQKISATLASTGTPSLFMHPAEALHGDLGQLTDVDCVLSLSNSGESEEILKLLPSILRLGLPMAAITSRHQSSLAQAASWCFSYQLPLGEGCPLDLAPMASTTLQMIWGDVLAGALMEARGFTREAFARNHPAGSLGAKFLKVDDLYHEDFPRVSPETPLVDLLSVMSAGRLGMCTVTEGEQLLGVVSDGDLRRGMEKAGGNGRNPLELRAKDIMTPGGISCRPEQLAIEVAHIMESKKITFLMVIKEGRLKGVLHLHDLLGAKVI